VPPTAAGTDTDTDTELRHGYTLGQISELARITVWHDVWHQSLPLPERLDIAWSAIAEHLYASDTRPARDELTRAAWSALRAETEAEWHHHGVSRTTTVYDGDRTMPAFTRYWFAFSRNTAGPEEPIIERMALAQIWDALPERHRTLIAALAATDDYGQAAAALGRPRQSYVTMLSEARKAFRELWHEGETPSRHWGTDHRANPDAAYRKTHPGRTAAIEAIRIRKRRRLAEVPPPGA
jgi:hypothetical protein